MSTHLKTALLAVSMTVVAACDTGPKGSAGFTLPEGDVEQGKVNYVAFGCNGCHSTSDIAQLQDADDSGISIALGGESARVRTYGELVTSIINPSHRVANRESRERTDEQGQSRMVVFNDVMTVTELVDLVAYVQSIYQISPYQYSAYPAYWHPEMEREEK